MLETVKSKSRMTDNEPLFLRSYKCRDCGKVLEFLLTICSGLESTARCDHCGSTSLELSTYHIKGDYFW